MTGSDFSDDYLSLRAANDMLRERAKTWVFETLNSLCLEFGPEVQLGRQEWKFEVGRSVMVGERFGLRSRGKTLLVEIGWPREPAHGFVPDQGLARGRVSLSASPMLSARVLEELILKVGGSVEPHWYVVRDGRQGIEVTTASLRSYIKTLLEA